MYSKIIVCDAGPLIALTKTNHMKILTHFFDKIIVPMGVIEECVVRPDLPGAQQIYQLIENDFFEIHPDPTSYEILLDILDLGERAAIQLALNLKSIVLIDEKRGRSIAKKLDVSVIGVAGVLLASYQKGLIPSLEQSINNLKSVGYRLSNTLIQELLNKAKMHDNQKSMTNFEKSHTI